MTERERNDERMRLAMYFDADRRTTYPDQKLLERMAPTIEDIMDARARNVL